MQEKWKSIAGIVGSVSGLVGLYFLFRDGWFFFAYLTQGEVTPQAQITLLCFVIQLTALALGVNGFLQAKKLGQSRGLALAGMIVPIILTIALVGLALVLVLLMLALGAFFSQFHY